MECGEFSGDGSERGGGEFVRREGVDLAWKLRVENCGRSSSGHRRAGFGPEDVRLRNPGQPLVLA